MVFFNFFGYHLICIKLLIKIINPGRSGVFFILVGIPLKIQFCELHNHTICNSLHVATVLQKYRNTE
jgi:hypothetical protein